MAKEEKPPHSKSPGEAKFLCERCLRGSGWSQCYTFKPGADTKLVCENCDRPQVVLRRAFVSGEHEPSRREDSKAMREARLELAKLQAELKALEGTNSVH